MRELATMTSKGRVTIPQEIRQRLGLKEGDKVIFMVEGGVAVLKPVREDDPFEKYAGALGSFETKDEINAWLADLRDEA